ncbi:DUF6318 family protein [Aeromicrobium piscarium]|uniref:DUF6318 domain-containing protein n=1 Tax=Aeromicrobium piscarium TaxID=2590901 RepID=A0A554SGM2_9ACTN|nr:DUF6318 family protein [Aeromicrobium piscarium]TSD65489.1 hypothetical protein FNM00_03425 [Aeromicrobium piscarium]
MVLPVLAMTLMGCSGGPDPPEETVSPSPEITAPAMPELAGDDSPAGAEAFARHYIEVLNYAALTGDTADLEELSADDCTGCAKYVDFYRNTYENGGRIIDSTWRVDSITTDFAPGSDLQYVTLETHITEGIHRESAESDPFKTEPSRDTVSMELMRSDHWSVSQLGLGGIG